MTGSLASPQDETTATPRTRATLLYARARTGAALVHAKSGEAGTAVVEFALVILPLTLILFGIIDFGRALNYYNDMTQLAGQGARAAAVNQNIDGTKADATFQQKLASENDSPELNNKVQVCIDGSKPTSVGNPVTVRVSYRFKFNAIIASVPITLSSTQTMRSETDTPSYDTGCSPAALP